MVEQEGVRSNNLRVCMAQGVANRDIKLENVLIDSSPRPLIKICDFGYSKVDQTLV